MAAEGTVTEPQYFGLFNTDRTTVRVELVKASTASSPAQVLDRARKKLAQTKLEDDDRIWLVVDRDTWPEAQLDECLRWVRDQPAQRGLALSNPCFEFWLLLHFENASGRSTHEEVRRALRNYLPDYGKRIDPAKFPRPAIEEAVARAKNRDRPPTTTWPQAAGSTVYRLVEQIIEPDS